MYAVLSVAVDLVHAASMVVWILGLPLLFVRRWPRLSLAYAVYAVAFVVVSQGSQLLLGECFLTTIARALQHWGALRGSPTDEAWFTQRAARAVFGLAPSRRAISVTFDVLVAVTAVGVLVRMLHGRSTPAAGLARDREPKPGRPSVAGRG